MASEVEKSPPIGLWNVTAIVGDGSVLHNAALVIDGTDIIALRPVADRGVRSLDVDWIDSRGRTVMPALINPHGHIGYLRGGVCDRSNFSFDNIVDHLQRLAYHGVGTFQSLGTDRDDIELAVRDAQRRGELSTDTATLFSASTGFVATTPGEANGGPGFATDSVLEITDVASARERARDVLAKNPDALKVWVDTRGDTKAIPGEKMIAAIVEEAHEKRVPVIAHIYDVGNAMTAVRAGVDGLAHMVQGPEGIDDELIDAMLANDVFQFSSISIHRTFLDDPSWMDEPWVRETVPPVAQREAMAEFADWPQHWLDMTSESLPVLERVLPRLKAAGVRLSLSGDTGLWTQFFGVAEHRELQALVLAGMTEMDAIEAATSVAAGVLGLSDRGVLAPGRRADILVLDADPLRDIRNTRVIRDVYLAGRRVDRAALRRRWGTSDDSANAAPSTITTDSE